MFNKFTSRQGFTLIELSIVLVIIGLIVGGILTGRDLIKAAEARAQIAQIEKYQTTVNAFYNKFGYLPGDIPNPYAIQFGFLSRGQYAGEGDGNGRIECIMYNSTGGNQGAFCPFQGEEAMFWVDLSTVGMIDANLSTATPAAVIASNVGLTGNPSISSFFPRGKFGNSYVYVWSGGTLALWQQPTNQASDGFNYFAVTGITGLIAGGSADTQEVGAITVNQAYNMDKKIDDGLPQFGNVTAMSAYWWAGDEFHGGPVTAGDGVASLPSSTTCYDNAGVAGATENYSLAQNSGSGLNCWLSFRMQGAR